MTKRRGEGLPQGWSWRRVEDVVDIETRVVLPEAGTTYIYVGLEHIESETGTFVGVAEVDRHEIQSNKFRFDSDHVLYGKLRPYLNKVALPDFEGICSTDILPLRPNGAVLREYVAFWLRSPRFVDYANTHATGTKMPRLGPTQFKAAPIPVPPLPVQERIVEILRKADEIRRKRQEALELLELILLSSFIHMFGDPLANSNGFVMKPLGSLAGVRSGVTKGRALRGKQTVEAPYLRVANVQDGYLDLAEMKTIAVLPEELEKWRLEAGDVLMTEGGDPDKLGRGCIWHEDIPGCIYQNHIFRVRADRTQLAPEYLAALLRTRYAKEYFFRCAKRTSNLASINSTQVKAFPVPLAPKAMQDRFVAAVAKWQEISLRLNATLKVAESAYRSILSNAFTGELTAAWEETQKPAIKVAAGEEALPFRRVTPTEDAKFETCIPLLSHKAAAGAFGQVRAAEELANAKEWVEPFTRRKLGRGMFVMQVSGTSMEPDVRDGDFCLFRLYEGGTRQGRVVLLMVRDASDPDAVSFALKRYARAGERIEGEEDQPITVEARSDNPAVEARDLREFEGRDVQTAAWFVDVLRREA